MARRNNAGGGGASLDSLLDTMTNVVGILVIMLVVTQLGVSDAVKRIKGFVDEITPDQLASAQSESERLKEMLAELKIDLEEAETDTADERVDLKDSQKLIEELKKDLAALKNISVDPNAIQKDVDKHQDQVAKLEKQINERQSKLASLKARLAKTPARGPDPEGKIVNLPDPRPAPKGASSVTFVCQGNRLMPLDSSKLREDTIELIGKAQRSLMKNNKIDCDKLVELFDRRAVTDTFFRVKMKIVGGLPYMVFEHRENRGDPLDNISKSTSVFQRRLRKIDPRKQYLRFLVWSDSYEAYLAAREVAAEKGFAAGWVPYEEGAEYREGLGSKVKLTCPGYKPPKPQPKSDKPAPPTDTID
ncbi:hypothetical protein Pan216_23300 [Planctomycetes bacterium Pan216]|uniref:Uncharacterized protein n=1 Tax=Kolteria novifilia TaxID=2527975 RepID=A0A518B397_9BACT|nr:hypothetical protein Pan216_23300 [Planctomycetes bacterium Pan216]